MYEAGLPVPRCVALAARSSGNSRYAAQVAPAAGFEATVIEDACRAIDLNGSLAKAWADMAAAGVERVTSDQIQGKSAAGA